MFTFIRKTLLVLNLSSGEENELHKVPFFLVQRFLSGAEGEVSGGVSSSALSDS